MTRKELIAAFVAGNDEYLSTNNLAAPRSKRRDLHAFLLIDQLLPNSDTVLTAAEHDVVFINADLDELSEVISKEQVLDLLRCGVRVDQYGDGLMMFV